MAELVRQIDISIDNLVGNMLQSLYNWETIEGFISYIMEKKEEAERIRKAQPTQQVDVIPDISDS